MIRRRSSALPAIVLPPSDDGLAESARANISAVLYAVGSGELSVRGARKIVDAAHVVRAFAEELEQLVGHTTAIASAGSVCERDIAALRAEIDAFRTQQAANAAVRAEAHARCEAIGAAVREELEQRALTAKLRNAQLQQQIDALKAASPSAAGVTSNASTSPPTAAMHLPHVDDATLARLSGEAKEIVRQVQAGNVPKGIRYPHHAFAGCLYLRARLDGLGAPAAAKHAEAELVAHFVNGAELTAAQIRAFGQEYVDLKRQLDAAAASKQGADALNALHRFGVAPAAAPRGAA